MSTKHTPGPWTIETPLGDDIFSIVQDGLESHNWDIIATVHSDHGEPDDGISVPVAKANADLIAAAPSMLRALHNVAEIAQRIIEQTPGSPLTAFILKESQAAIAKAKGGA